MSDEAREPGTVRTAGPATLLDGHPAMVSPVPRTSAWRAISAGATLRGPNPQ
jgi:hypothetical protein